MRLGILKAGAPPADLGKAVPSYPQMIENALGQRHCYEIFDATQGELPTSAVALDGFIVTGSAAAVYDGDPWILALRNWLRALDPTVPLIGICFGHQIMAEAFGGHVARSPHGWLGGLQDYVMEKRVTQEWSRGVERFTLPAAHQDQIVVPPPSAHILAGNALCRYAAITYEGRRALSLQAHPEFEARYSSLLIDHQLRAGQISVEAAAAAHASLCGADDRALMSVWLDRFLSAAR